MHSLENCPWLAWHILSQLSLSHVDHISLPFPRFFYPLHFGSSRLTLPTRWEMHSPGNSTTLYILMSLILLPNPGCPSKILIGIWIIWMATYQNSKGVQMNLIISTFLYLTSRASLPVFVSLNCNTITPVAHTRKLNVVLSLGPTVLTQQL